MLTAEELRKRKTEHAQLTIKLHGEGLTYTDAVRLGDSARNELETLSPFDAMYRFAIKRQNTAYNVADAINWLEGLDNTSHLFTVEALISRNKEPGVEVTALISKSNSEGMRKSAVLCYYFESLIFAGKPTGNPSEYEVVLL